MDNLLICPACGAPNTHSEAVLANLDGCTVLCRCRYCGINWTTDTAELDDTFDEYDDDRAGIDVGVLIQRIEDI